MIVWHVLTPEYPPDCGGVADYTRIIGEALAQFGDEVHVWCPPSSSARQPGRASIHEARWKTIDGIRSAGRDLDAFAGPRRLLVQWVPHGFGMKAMNVPFCLWLAGRSLRGDRVELMAHEAFLPFERGRSRQNAAAIVQRLMTAIVLAAADRVWISVLRWATVFRPLSIKRHEFRWLPVVSNVGVALEPDRTAELRSRCAGLEGTLFGHFGTFTAPVTALLEPVVEALLGERPGTSALFIGRGSDRFRDAYLTRHPSHVGRVSATGQGDERELSIALSACDVMIQPYPDGVSTRRGSTMAALAHGLPIVTNRVEGTTEPIWRTSGAVCLTESTNAGDFVETAARLLDNPADRKRLGQAASSLYETEFDARHIAARLREVEL